MAGPQLSPFGHLAKGRGWTMRGISFQRGAYLIAGAMLVLATSACSSSDSEDLYGVWLTPDNSNLLSFNEDDTWTFTHQEDPENIRGFGTFTFDGELLTLSTDPASLNCSPNAGEGLAADAVGIYEVAFTDEGDLELTDVDDPCIRRVVEFRGVRTNTDLPHQTGTLVSYSP
jgi:hypothetical protein